MFGRKRVPDASICPIDKKECIGEPCKGFIHVQGRNPQDGSEMNQKDCAIRWIPMMLIELSKEVRQDHAAVNNERNAVASAMREFTDAARGMVQAMPFFGGTLIEGEGAEKGNGQGRGTLPRG